MITSIQVPYRVFEKYILSDGRSGISLHTTFVMNRLLRTAPDTVKRPKPIDLFASATARKVSQDITTGTCEYWKSSGGILYTYSGDSTHRLFNMQPKVLHSPDFSALLNRVRSKVRGDAVNLAQALAEYRQTAELFSDLTHKLVDITLAVVKRNPNFLKTRKNWSKKTSDAHLQWIYGVSPLLQDIDGAMKALAERILHKPVTLEGYVLSRKNALLSTVSDPSMNYVAKAHMDYTDELSMKVAYRATLNSDFISDGLSAYGFTNPAALLYELTPYSFVFDWWFNLGDVLQSLDNCLIIDSIVVRKSYYSKRTTLCSYKSGNWNGAGYYGSTVSERYAPEAIGLISTLNFKPSTSAIHIANGLALITSRFSKYLR